MVAIYIILGSLSWNRGKDGVNVITLKSILHKRVHNFGSNRFPFGKCNIDNSFLFAFHIT